MAGTRLRRRAGISAETMDLTDSPKDSTFTESMQENWWKQAMLTTVSVPRIDLTN